MSNFAARLVTSFLLLIGLCACQPSSNSEKPLNSPSQQTLEFDRLFAQFDDMNKPGASVAVLQVQGPESLKSLIRPLRAL